MSMPGAPKDNDPINDDPILDVALREVLGGETPPDLSERIMAAWMERGQGNRQPAIVHAASGSSAETGTLAADGHVLRIADRDGRDSTGRNASDRSARRASRRPRYWVPAAVAASLVLAIGGYFAFRGGEEQVADRPAGPEPIARQGSTPRTKEIAKHSGRPSEKIAGSPKHASSEPRDAKSSRSTGEVEAPKTAKTNPAGAPAVARAAESGDELSSPTPPVAQPGTVAARVSAASDEEVIAYIDELIRQGWTDAGLSASPDASDSEWCRRVYLDVLGRIPAADETLRFVNDRSADKKKRLVDRLLDSDEYIEDFARNWTTIWTNILVGRSGGTEQGTLISREGLQQYLRRTFLTNKPYDQFVTELVSAEGANQPGAEGFNGAVNFLLHNLDENATPATAKTARIFLGLQVQCTQCHNHPFNEDKQDQFWSLNAFFRQTRFIQVGEGQTACVRLEDVDFAGEGGNPLEAEVYFETRNGLLKVAYPMFVDGTKIAPSGFVREVNRRDELARLIVGSPYMSRAIVNRMWGHFLGCGFSRPVDDMGPHNAPSHPELLERLAGDFAGHGHDLKQLIRWITLSEAYGLSSRVTPKNERDNPAVGESSWASGSASPRFSRFYLRQMRAEELYHSLLVATGAHKAGGGDYAALERRKAEWLSQFTIAFGTDEGDETTTFNGTIPQTLMMWNGELVNRATSGERGTYLHTVAMTESKSSAKIKQLFLTALSRRPTAIEVRTADQLWRARQGDTLGALADIWWVVLNSNEFIFNH